MEDKQRCVYICMPVEPKESPSFLTDTILRTVTLSDEWVLEERQDISGNIYTMMRPKDPGKELGTVADIMHDPFLRVGSSSSIYVYHYCDQCGQVVEFQFIQDDGNAEVYKDAAGHQYRPVVR